MSKIVDTPTTQLTSFILPYKKSPGQDAGSIVSKYLYHWPLFVIGLVLSLAAAGIYLKMAKPLYEVKATLLINDEKKVPEQRSALQEIDLSSSSLLIENEIEVLRSKNLISEVVKDLQLSTAYTLKKGMVSTDLYKKAPFKFVLINGSILENKKLDIIVKDSNSFLLKNDGAEPKELKFNTVIASDFGKWKLEPYANLTQFVGETIQIHLADPEAMTLAIQNSINISIPNKLSTSILLTVEDNVPERGIDLLNQLIATYNSAAVQRKDYEIRSTLSFLDQRIAALTGELNEAERGIEGYKASRNLTDISSDSKISLENLQANDSKLNEVEIKLTVVNGIEEYLSSSSNFERTPATAGIVDPALSSLIEKLAQLQLQKERLLATTPETNPDFDVINRQISTTRTAIKENVTSIKASLLSTKAKLQSYNTGYESSIRNIPTQERQLLNIKRQQAIKENLYTYLLQKREEVSIKYGNTNDRVIDQAYAGPQKGPKKAIVLAMSMLLGLILPAGLIYGRSFYNRRIIDLQEIKDAVSVPVIAELPYLKSGHDLALNNSETNSLTEQLRALRTKLYYLHNKNESGRVTLVTSSLPGEGKSFLSSNLAVALSEIGRKTVLLELDLRKPKIAEIFNLSKKSAGVGDFLTLNAKFDDIVQNTSINRDLSVITSGALTSNPTALLEKNELGDLIAFLRLKYDDIIIDSPPLHLVPDAMILAKSIDVTLYVIKQGVTEFRELSFINELQENQLIPGLNIVFNGIKGNRYGYGYEFNERYYNVDNHRRGSIFSDFATRF